MFIGIDDNGFLGNFVFIDFIRTPRLHKLCTLNLGPTDFDKKNMSNWLCYLVHALYFYLNYFQLGHRFSAETIVGYFHLAVFVSSLFYFLHSSFFFRNSVQYRYALDS